MRVADGQRQENVRTLKSPRYLLTRQRNVCHGANSMSCAKMSLPACIYASRESPGRLPNTVAPIQIVNTLTRHELRAALSFQLDNPKICRTVVL